MAASRNTFDKRMSLAEAHDALFVPHSRADSLCMKRAENRGLVTQPIPGAFARHDYLRELVQNATPHDLARILIQGAAEAHPSWVFCQSSAALLHGLDPSYELVKKLYIISNQTISPKRSHRKDTWRNADGQVAQQSGPQDKRPSLAAEHHASRRSRQKVVTQRRWPCIQQCYRSRHIVPEEIDRVKVTPFWDTVVDCCLVYPFQYALAIADSALQKTCMSKADFYQMVEDMARHRKHVRRARFLAQHADGLSENGGESQVRAYLIQHGYQLPALQVPLPNPVEPGRYYRVDFYWILPDGRIIVGEFDGRDKYRSKSLTGGRDEFEVRFRERQRESHITLLGYPVVRFTWDDLIRPARMERLLAAAGIPKDTQAEASWPKMWRALGAQKG